MGEWLLRVEDIGAEVPLADSLLDDAELGFA
jgi:hypothetical protein